MWKYLIIPIVTLAVIVASMPGILYLYGLYGIDKYPDKYNFSLDRNVTLKIWGIYQGEGDPRLFKMNPWSYYKPIYCDAQASIEEQVKECRNKYPGTYAAAKLAQSYLGASNKKYKNLDWHISAAALSVWLSRNWSIEEILCGLYFYEQKRLTSQSRSHAKSACWDRQTAAAPY